MNVLTIGYGRNLFDPHNNERVRMRACAAAVTTLTMVVFSRSSHQCRVVLDGPLSIYPTDTRTRIGMLIRAYVIGSRVLKNRPARDGEWIVSVQDPFETALVGYLLHLRYGVAFQIQEHGDFFGKNTWRTEAWSNMARFVMGRFVLRRATCVRVVSARTEEHLVRLGVERGRIACLSVATEKVSVSPAPQTVVKGDGRVHILAVGRLVAQKNFFLLIRAFAQIHKRRSDVKLTIVGSGPEESVLRAVAQQYGCAEEIVFVPWTHDIDTYYATADIFALSSNYEGWGRVIVEAMAAGLPSVVTDVGCVGQLFMHEEHGLVVPVGNEQQFAESLMRLIEDRSLRLAYGNAAQNAARAYRSSEGVYAEQWANTLRKCLSGRSAVQ